MNTKLRGCGCDEIVPPSTLHMHTHSCNANSLPATMCGHIHLAKLGCLSTKQYKQTPGTGLGTRRRTDHTSQLVGCGHPKSNLDPYLTIEAWPVTCTPAMPGTHHSWWDDIDAPTVCLFFFLPLVGFEPPTSGVAVHCANHYATRKPTIVCTSPRFTCNGLPIFFLFAPDGIRTTNLRSGSTLC